MQFIRKSRDFSFKKRVFFSLVRRSLRGGRLTLNSGKAKMLVKLTPAVVDPIIFFSSALSYVYAGRGLFVQTEKNCLIIGAFGGDKNSSYLQLRKTIFFFFCTSYYIAV